MLNLQQLLILKKFNNNKINANFYSSIKDMFKSETIDGVIIATPNSSHFKDG